MELPMGKFRPGGFTAPTFRGEASGAEDCVPCAPSWWNGPSARGHRRVVGCRNYGISGQLFIDRLLNLR